MTDPINVVEIIDSQKISWLQIRVALLGAITLMLDGFDNQMIAYVAPALKSAWHLSAGALGPVFSAGVFGDPEDERRLDCVAKGGAAVEDSLQPMGEKRERAGSSFFIFVWVFVVEI